MILIEIASHAAGRNVCGCGRSHLLGVPCVSKSNIAVAVAKSIVVADRKVTVMLMRSSSVSDGGLDLLGTCSLHLEALAASGHRQGTHNDEPRAKRRAWTSYSNITHLCQISDKQLQGAIDHQGWHSLAK